MFRIWMAVFGLATAVSAAMGQEGDEGILIPDKGETVLLLHLDEGAGQYVHDATYNGYHGFIRGAKWVDGRFGKALEFDGESEVNLYRPEKVDFGKREDFTVECWIKVPQDLGPGFYFFLANRLRVDMAGFSLYLHRSGHVVAGIGDKVNQVGLHGKSQVNDGAWHHVAITADRDGDAVLYLDGVEHDRAGIDHLVTVSNEQRPLLIGSRGHGTGFVGAIDEVRISRGVRTRFLLNGPYEK